MTRGVAAVSFSCLALFLTGCPSDGTMPSAPPSPPLDPQYVACISTAPLDPGNPNEPVITLNGARAVTVQLGGTYVDAGAKAADPQDGDITSQIKVSGLSDVNTNAVGDYLVRYDVVDRAGLAAAEVSRMVRVTDGTFASESARDLGSTAAHMAYYEHLPVNYGADDTAFPVIISQAGYGGARFTDDGTAVQAPLSILYGADLSGVISSGQWDDSRPFIVLTPQRCTDPLTFVVTANQMRLFIDYAIHTYKIDSSRIYMVGFSQGSGDTWDYVNNYPNQLAAVVPISGPYGTSVGCVLKNTPAWAFNGEADIYVPYQGQVDTVNSINVCNPPERAKITVLPGVGHTDNPEIYLTGLGQGIAPYDVYDPSIYDWLLAHKRATGVSARAAEAGAAAAWAAETGATPASAAPAAIQLAIIPQVIRSGQPATLAWAASGAESCTASGDWFGKRPVRGAESFIPPAAGLYNYSLACQGPGGESVQSISLVVVAAGAGPLDITLPQNGPGLQR